MKRTAARALIASRVAVSEWTTDRRKRLAVSGLVVVAAILSGFLLGRGSIDAPASLQQAVAGLHLEILLQQRDVDRLQRENRNSINALAARLAELQAASTRIDALGERLAQMGQLTLDEFDFNQPAPLGGPADPASLTPANAGELPASIGLLGEKLQRQSSQLHALQYLMVNRQLEDDMTPSGWPVRKGWISSRYGERTDPFTGQRTQHRGLDFVGTRGSDVLSVAGGVVVWAGNRTGFGKTVEIDHGNGYQTRYAHNDSLVVQPGDPVRAGQLIARIGSSGRASAPHVHFEVLQNGNIVNPGRFVSNLR